MSGSETTYDPDRVFHYGYVVADMDRAIKVWLRQGAALIVPPAVDPIQNVTCSLLIYKRGVPIELVAPLPSGPNPVAGRLSKGGGLDHVCLFTEDLKADLELLELEGGMTVVQPCYGAVFRRNLAFVLTRAGLVVELMTRHMVDNEAIDPLAAFLEAKSV